MKIKIIKILNEANLQVEFSSEIGNGIGEWKSEDAPNLFAEYHVEFDINDELIWGNNINYSEKLSSSMYTKDDKTLLHGQIESVDKDTNTCYMRISDALLMFSCKGNPNFINQLVSIKAKSIFIYDMNY